MTEEPRPTFAVQLSAFDVFMLGEGNAVAGVNLLAAAACAITNTLPRSRRFITDGGRRFEAGTSLAISGPTSSGPVAGLVVAALADCQRNSHAHLVHWQGTARLQERLKPGERKLDEGRTLFRPDESLTLKVHAHAPSQYEYFDSGPDFAGFAATSPALGKLEMHCRPSVFASAETPSKLEAAAGLAHGCELLVHAGLGEPSAVSRFAPAALAAVDGRLAGGTGSAPVRATFLVTDPSGHLADVLKHGGPGAEWLSRMVWLTDCGAGPKPPKPPKPQKPAPGEKSVPFVMLNLLAERFEIALRTAWGERLNYRTTTFRRPGDVPNFGGHQAGWMKSLRAMEGRVPGITHAARTLPATLIIGIRRLLESIGRPAGFVYEPNIAFDLAELLVERMACARAVMADTEEKERQRRLAAALVTLLGKGPSTVRDLTRSRRYLTADRCREVLNLLADEGVVTLCGDRWLLTSADASLEPVLTLDV